MFHEPKPIKGGLRQTPLGPVAAGVRRRGAKKKPTPFISIRKDIAEQALGSDCVASGCISLLIGTKDSHGLVKIVAREQGGSNASLRRPVKKGSEEYVVETLLIPYGFDETMRKQNAGFQVVADGLLISLPWFKDDPGGNL